LEVGTKENPRHICGISGGKDSSALVIHIKRTRPELFDKLELFFTDTGSELPEVYTYLEKMEKFLGKTILRIKVDLESAEGYKAVTGEDQSVPFDEILKSYKGYLPAPNARWCTRVLKLKPLEAWINGEYCISYIGLRADEPEREGYSSRTKANNIIPNFPFRQDGIEIDDVYRILEETVGLPEYYKWRTRSGCYFCFYQRRVEWAILFNLYPEWFEKSKEYETQHEDGRTFTWVKDKPLDYVEQNYKDIIIRYITKQYKKSQNQSQFHYALSDMINLVQQGQIRELVDSWDIKSYMMLTVKIKKVVPFAQFKEINLMRWSIIKNGEEVETADCIYDACDKVSFVEYPREDFKFIVDCKTNTVTIIVT
jgi:hypothetical protein